jgi:aspartate kinase
MAGGFCFCSEKDTGECVMSGMAEQQRDAASTSQPMVMKFGGTSLEDSSAIRRAGQIVRQRLGQKPVVVVSAFSNVTDQLLEAGKLAAGGQSPAASDVLANLQRRHEQIVMETANADSAGALQSQLLEDFSELRQILQSVCAAGELTPRLQDRLLGFGEVMASRVVQAAFVNVGLAAVRVDALACIVTDAAHTQATPLWDETDQHLRSSLLPLLTENKIPMLGGFIGATRDGIPTTLGRGGSDFTASIVGAALQASRIEIWTDVDGILTTDPKLCPEARRVPTMSFEEAADLAYFGARMLHPAAITPAMRKNIPVWVLNSRNPDGKGTEIVAHPPEECSLKAITAKKGVTVVDVQAVRWFAPELLREIFAVFEHYQYGLDFLSASRGSLSLLVTSTDALPKIAEELKGLATVRWESEKALVCLVGEKVRRQPEIASQVFRALSEVDLRMFCQGASERNISFLVDEAQAEDTLRRLHRLFFQSRFDRYSAANVTQPMCQAGGSWQ